VTRARGYQQFCPTAAALDAVGDRWALLVVRELILGPRRFTELQQGLPGIGTDILTARLRALEADDVLRRIGKGRAQRYELTDRGRALRPVLVALAHWGAERLELPADPDDVSPRVALTSLLLDPPPLPAAAAGDYEIRVADETARFSFRDGCLTLDAAAEPSTVIDLTPRGLRGLLLGLRTRDLKAGGELSVDGDTRAASQLLDALTAPRILDGLRRRSRPARVPRR
jgi:DNA-binding HxlR family transcriptional regulator